jgi:hypothetical protein
VGTFLNQQGGNFEMLAPQGKAERGAGAIGGTGIRVGATDQEFANDSQVALKAGCAQREAAMPMNIDLFEVGAIVQCNDNAAQASGAYGTNEFARGECFCCHQSNAVVE